MGLECLLRRRKAPVVPDLGRDKVVLEVGVSEVRTAADEAARLDITRAGGTGPVKEPLEACLDHPEPKLLFVKADGLSAGLDNVDIQMILEVLPNPGEMVDRLHSNLAKVIRVADTRQHQKLGRVDRAPTQDDLV